jgi:hypothetical protein
LDAFVTGYVAHVFRREVTETGSERKTRWCPRWWDHGEAVAVFDALWSAFEHLRLGETDEMSTFLLTHAYPALDRIFALDGPFQYCSVARGHSADLVALPTIAAPEGMFEDGHAHDEPAGTTTSSGLIVPAPPIGAVNSS